LLKMAVTISSTIPDITLLKKHLNQIENQTSGF